MKILLVGYGKMGKLLEARLLERGHTLSCVVDPVVYNAKPANGSSFSGAKIFASIKDALPALAGGGMAIEFTKPDTAPANIILLAEQKIPVVCGTTGWYDKLPEIGAAVEKAGSALLWSSNFSLGVNLFYRIAEYAARLMDNYPEYDAGGFEVHHNKKADSPSGTAKILAEKVLARLRRKSRIVYDKLDRPPAGDELHFASLRVGAAPGIHSLVFDSDADSIEITHTARNREGLASGAISAAEWLCAKKRTGVFTIDDALEDMLKE
ncbi:MAG: 4-hydroxy-tetrahydrodipicolinate reductase [Treponema sp.]|jgi:4-hydroxy-tetrahydrodipicolinate reductase|nr:4-hydroxy-tetrahydrodipicolinate reductase [Treponema sp.]